MARLQFVLDAPQRHADHGVALLVILPHIHDPINRQLGVGRVRDDQPHLQPGSVGEVPCPVAIGPLGLARPRLRRDADREQIELRLLDLPAADGGLDRLVPVRAGEPVRGQRVLADDQLPDLA